MSSSLSPGLEAHEAPLRNRKHRLCVPWSDEQPGSWAVVRWTARCVDPLGYRRRTHTYLVEARRGTCCLFCGAVRPWEAL
jgi:hypothetical protein